MWRFESNNVQLVNVNKEYTDYLRQFESRISEEHENSNKRPFIGILVSTSKNKFVLPPKDKHKKMKNSIDFHKINNGIWGAINLNNMFPVNNNVYSILNPSNLSIGNNSDRYYKELLVNQLTWLNLEQNANKIVNKAENLYNKYYDNSLNIAVKNRCCNFPLLEQRCNEYELMKNKNMK